MTDSEEDAAAEEALVHAMARQVDGVIICAPFASDTQLARLATVTNLVLVNRRHPGISAVLMNTAHGMRQAIAHLVALGHRRCAYLSGPRNAWSNQERQRGLRAALASHAMEIVELGPFEPKFDGGIQAADAACATGATALLAFNDLMALGVLSRLHALKLRVPQDISVLGFDNVLYASMCAPPLTTVSMPMENAGRAAVDLLLSQLPGEPAERLAPRYRELSTDLIVRSTTDICGTTRARQTKRRERAT
jgi:LacI family transcriptional regulator